MSPEQSKRHGQRRASAEHRYRCAVQALAVSEAAFLALDKMGAGAAAKLEALDTWQKARRIVGHEQREVINAAWADGTLSHVEHLGEVVGTMLAELAGPYACR